MCSGQDSSSSWIKYTFWALWYMCNIYPDYIGVKGKIVVLKIVVLIMSIKAIVYKCQEKLNGHQFFVNY
jgi:hypothetical protein